MSRSSFRTILDFGFERVVGFVVVVVVVEPDPELVVELASSVEPVVVVDQY